MNIGRIGSMSVVMGALLSGLSYGNWAFDGRLILPPVCQLSQQNPLEVSFGKVGVGKVDGKQYEQSIPYELQCDGENTTTLGQRWKVSLTFSGTPAGAGFDDATLKVAGAENAGNAGIRIQKDGTPQPLNTAFLIDVAALPRLSAVPVKRPGSDLVAGDFTATGTLTVSFQ